MFNLFKAFGRRPADQPAQAPAAKPRPIPWGLLAEASKRMAQDKLQERRPSPFQIALHPPRATPPKPLQMAMDDSLNWAGAQAAGSILNSVSTEGLLFLGYPFLAELSQRPEYRVISETIGTEATRKFIKFKGSGTGDVDKTEKIKELTDEFDRLDVRDRFRDLAVQDGFFGRSHLFLDFGTGLDPGSKELASPIGDGRDKLSLGKVKKGSLKRLQTVEAVWTYPTTYNSTNPLSEDWYNPQVWYVLGTEIHRSRLLTFIGHPVPDMLKPAYSFGGLSLSQMAMPYVDIWLATRTNVASLIRSFSVMVLMTDLSTMVQEGADVSALFARVAAFNAFRDNQGTFVVNKATEDFKNVSASLAGLHELQAQSQEHLMSVARIPAVKFTGIQPSGLNASSDGELRAFGDTIAAYQNMFFRPNLTRVMNFAMLNLWGAVDPEITFDFEPLEEMNEKEEAEIRKIEAETDDILVNGCQAISPEEVRQRVASDPDTLYSSLDVEDVPEPPPDESGNKINIRGTEPFGAEKQGQGQGQDEASFEESKHPRDAGGKFGSGGASGGAAEKLTPAQAKQKTAAWLSRARVSSTLDTVAKTVATKVKDPEVIKGALGSALNAAIGHYWLGHTDFDALIISEAMQHIEVGLAVSAAQAKDVMRKTVDALITAYRKPAKDAADAEPETQESDEDVLEALEALREALGEPEPDEEGGE